jgi:hypothetical protein
MLGTNFLTSILKSNKLLHSFDEMMSLAYRLFRGWSRENQRADALVTALEDLLKKKEETGPSSSLERNEHHGEHCAIVETY